MYSVYTSNLKSGPRKQFGPRISPEPTWEIRGVRQVNTRIQSRIQGCSEYVRCSEHVRIAGARGYKALVRYPLRGNARLSSQATGPGPAPSSMPSSFRRYTFDQITQHTRGTNKGRFRTRARRTRNQQVRGAERRQSSYGRLARRGRKSVEASNQTQRQRAPPERADPIGPSAAEPASRSQ